MGLGEDAKRMRMEGKLEKLKGETQDLLRKILTVTQSLEQLPKKAYLAIKLTYYDEVTPEDYEPQGFGPDLTKEVPMPSGSYRVSLGRADSGFHAIRVQMEARQQGMEASFVNDSYAATQLSQSQLSQSQQLSGESPLESGGESSQALVEEEKHSQDMEDSQDSQMSEKVFSFSQQDSPASTVKLGPSSSSSPTTVVSCICQNGSLDPLMLMCSICSTAQHATCYRILSEQEVPARHVCWSCSKENPDLSCTDPKMDRFSGREEAAAPTCLFRRVLVMLERAEVNTITADIIQARLNLSEAEATNLVHILTKKLLKESAGELIIDKEALKDSMRKYLGIKDTRSNSVTSTSSSQRINSKRKEEKMAAMEVVEPRKKKKSRISDLEV